MRFVPASQPGPSTSPLAWCFAFVGGHLLLPEGDPQGLQPLAPAGLAGQATVQHYLGTLAAHDHSA